MRSSTFLTSEITQGSAIYSAAYVCILFLDHQSKESARNFCTACQCVAMASCPVPTLESLESIIRDKILKDQNTHKQVSNFLRKKFPWARGFSIWFCSARGIHKTVRLCDSALDEAVSSAVEKVHNINRIAPAYRPPIVRTRRVRRTSGAIGLCQR